MSRPPARKIIGSEMYALTMFRVESRDERGRPESLTLIPRDRVVELSEDPEKNQFILGYVREAELASR